MEEADVARDRLVEPRAVGDVVEQAGQATRGSEISSRKPKTDVSQGPRSGLRKARVRRQARRPVGGRPIATGARGTRRDRPSGLAPTAWSSAWSPPWRPSSDASGRLRVRPPSTEPRARRDVTAPSVRRVPWPVVPVRPEALHHCPDRARRSPVLSVVIHTMFFVADPPGRITRPHDAGRTGRRILLPGCRSTRTPLRGTGRPDEAGRAVLVPPLPGRPGVDRCRSARWWSPPSWCPTSTCRGSLPWYPRIPDRSTHWPERRRSSGIWLPHGNWSTVCAVVLAIAVIAWGPTVARRLPWRPLVMVAWLTATAWTVSLTLIDGVRAGLGRSHERHRRLPGPTPTTGAACTRSSTGLPPTSPRRRPGPWDISIAGNPPGALLTFFGLDRVGLGGPWWASALCVVVGASSAAAVLVAVRALGDEALARRAAPFVALAPVAVWVGVSTDGYYAGCRRLGTGPAGGGRRPGHPIPPCRSPSPRACCSDGASTSTTG